MQSRIKKEKKKGKAYLIFTRSEEDLIKAFLHAPTFVH